MCGDLGGTFQTRFPRKLNNIPLLPTLPPNKIQTLPNQKNLPRNPLPQKPRHQPPLQNPPPLPRPPPGPPCRKFSAPQVARFGVCGWGLFADEEFLERVAEEAVRYPGFEEFVPGTGDLG